MDADLEAQTPYLPDWGYGPGVIGPADSMSLGWGVYGRPLRRIAYDTARVVAPVAASVAINSVLGFTGKKRKRLLTDGSLYGRVVRRKTLELGYKRLKQKIGGGVTRGHLPKMPKGYKKKKGRTYSKRRYVRKRQRANKKLNFQYAVKSATSSPHYVQRVGGLHFDGILSGGQLLFLEGMDGVYYTSNQATSGDVTSWLSPKMFSVIRSIAGAATTADLHVSNLKLMWRLKNNDDTCLWFRKWVLKPRRDYFVTASSTTVGQGNTPMQFIKNCLDADGYYNSGSGVSQNIHGMMWEPYQSTSLCSQFEIKGGKSVCIKAGMDFVFTKQAKKVWHLNYNRVNRLFHKEQRIIVLQVMGDVAHNKAAIGQTGMSKPFIDGICEWSCNFEYTHTTKYTPNTSTALVATTLETMADEDMKNEDV